jgi:hypothetical protein
MTPSVDRELNAWMDDWQADAAAGPAAQQIRDYVHRRSRLLRIFFVTDTLIGIGFAAFLVHRAVTHPDPFEKLAMSLLAVIAVGATVFGWINWRGAIVARGEDTATFMALAVSRIRRMQRSVRAAWCVLGAQFLVFTPWVWHRVYSDPASPPSNTDQLMSWGLLAVMMSLALAFVLAVQRWARREARIVRDLQRELGSESEEIVNP